MLLKWIHNITPFEIDKRRNSGYKNTSLSRKKFIHIFWVDEFEKLEEILIDIKNGVLALPGKP